MPTTQYTHSLLAALSSKVTTIPIQGDGLLALAVNRDFSLGYVKRPIGIHVPANEWVLVQCNHSYHVCVPGNALTPVWTDSGMRLISFAELRPRMRIPRIANFSLAPRINSIVIPRRIIEMARAEGLELQNPLPLGEEVGRVLGRMLGDGWGGLKGDEPRFLYFANKDNAQFARLRADFRAGFLTATSRDLEWRSDPRPSLNGSGGTIVRITPSYALANLIYWLIGRGANRKKLPRWIIAAAWAFRVGLVDGLLDTDGSISAIANADFTRGRDWRMTYTTTSPQAANMIHQLFASVGLWSTVTQCPPRFGHASVFAINVRCEHASRWPGEGMVNQLHRARLAQTRAYSGETPRSIPASPHLYRLYIALPLARRLLDRGTVHNATHVRGAMRAPLFRALSGVFDKDDYEASPYLREWRAIGLNEQIDWHEVQNVSNRPSTYQRIQHTRSAGPDHLIDNPLPTKWHTSPLLYKLNNGFIATGCGPFAAGLELPASGISPVEGTVLSFPSQAPSTNAA